MLFFCFLGALAHASHQEEWWWRDTDGDEVSLLPFLDTRHAWHCARQVGCCYLTREFTIDFSHLENSSEIFLWKFQKVIIGDHSLCIISFWNYFFLWKTPKPFKRVEKWHKETPNIWIYYVLTFIRFKEISLYLYPKHLEVNYSPHGICFLLWLFTSSHDGLRTRITRLLWAALWRWTKSSNTCLQVLHSNSSMVRV